MVTLGCHISRHFYAGDLEGEQAFQWCPDKRLRIVLRSGNEDHTPPLFNDKITNVVEHRIAEFRE